MISNLNEILNIDFIKYTPNLFKFKILIYSMDEITLNSIIKCRLPTNLKKLYIIPNNKDLSLQWVTTLI